MTTDYNIIRAITDCVYVIYDDANTTYTQYNISDMATADVSFDWIKDAKNRHFTIKIKLLEVMRLRSFFFFPDWCNTFFFSRNC